MHCMCMNSFPSPSDFQGVDVPRGPPLMKPRMERMQDVSLIHLGLSHFSFWFGLGPLGYFSGSVTQSPQPYTHILAHVTSACSIKKWSHFYFSLKKHPSFVMHWFNLFVFEISTNVSSPADSEHRHLLSCLTDAQALAWDFTYLRVTRRGDLLWNSVGCGIWASCQWDLSALLDCHVLNKFSCSFDHPDCFAILVCYFSREAFLPWKEKKN